MSADLFAVVERRRCIVCMYICMYVYAGRDTADEREKTSPFFVER